MFDFRWWIRIDDSSSKRDSSPGPNPHNDSTSKERGEHRESELRPETSLLRQRRPPAALAANGSRIISLIISDIVGNPVGAIASGPTAPDPTTFGQALQILQDYRISKKVPGKVLRRLREGARGHFPETAKPGNPAFEKVTNFILGDNSVACLSALKTLKKNNSMKMTYLGSSWQGESRDTAANLTGLLLALVTIKPARARENRWPFSGEEKPQ